MITKTCTKCNKKKPLDGFYPYWRNGEQQLAAACKDCTKSAVRRHRRDSPRPREYDRERAKTPERRIHARAITIRWRQENPEGYRAQTALGNALRDGKIKKPKHCQHPRCLRTDLHAHHEDYSKPLEVEWLCALHHHRLNAILS